MHSILQILPEPCHFSNTETALLLCFLLLQENTNSIVCSLHSSIMPSVLSDHKQEIFFHLFSSKPFKFTHLHIYCKTESGADQKLAHGLSLSTSVFQSSFSCKRAKPQGTRGWIFFDATTTAKGQVSSRIYEIFFHFSFDHASI